MLFESTSLLDREAPRGWKRGGVATRDKAQLYAISSDKPRSFFSTHEAITRDANPAEVLCPFCDQHQVDVFNCKYVIGR